MLPYASWLVWVAPTISATLVPIIARFGERARKYFALFVSLVTLVFAVSMISEVYSRPSTSLESNFAWIPELGGSLGVLVDNLSILFATLIAFFGLVIVIYSFEYMANEEGLTRYYSLLLLFVGSMIGLVMSDNFLQMFVFWEMVGICSFSLISFWYKRREAVQAGVKAFLMTRVGDVCLLAAIILLYTRLGSFSFSYIIANIQTVPLPVLTAVAFLMLTAALAKSAQLPLHTWLYSAMEAPTSVSALLHAATMVKAGVFLLARLFILFGPLIAFIPMWSSSLIWIGTLSAFVGATLALRTSDIKGVPAYSTISQTGFMFAALGFAASSANSFGWFASMFYLVNHALFQGLDFLIIGGIIHAVRTRDMRLMGGLRKAMPAAFSLSIIVLLARTGIPPLASFFSKELIISGFLSTGDISLIAMAYITTALTFAYALRFVVLVFLRGQSTYMKGISLHEAPRTMLFSSGILALSCVSLILIANPLARFLQTGISIRIADFFGLSSVVFALLLFIGGFSIYLTYYRRTAAVKEHAGFVLSLVRTVLGHAYFFDDFYKLVADGLGKTAGVLRSVDNVVFDHLLYLAANGVMSLAQGTRKYFCTSIDELIYVAVNRTLRSASKIGKMHEESLHRYIVVALVGFLILLVLVILTMLR